LLAAATALVVVSIRYLFWGRATKVSGFFCFTDQVDEHSQQSWGLFSVREKHKKANANYDK
jgi:hypothetical protein